VRFHWGIDEESITFGMREDDGQAYVGHVPLGMAILTEPRPWMVSASTT
jgi:hypothetical protein